MTLNQLRYFCIAARMHSITKAAQELFVTQPTISLAIRELEIELGITLFYRTGNRLLLTKEGERLYEKADFLTRYCAELAGEFSSQGKKRPAMRIGYPPMLGTIFFPALYRAFCTEYPDCPVILEEYGSKRACDLIQSDALDAALVNMEVYNIDRFNSLNISESEIVFCVAPGHRLASKAAVSIEDLRGEPLILFNADSMLNQLVRAKFDAIGENPSIIMQGSQLYTSVSFVKSENCGAFLFRNMVQRYEGLIPIPFDPPMVNRVGLVWKPGKYMSTELKAFIDFTKKYYAEHELGE